METQTPTKTGFASPGRWIETEALRQIYTGLDEATMGFDASICSFLGIAIPTEVEVGFRLDLPEERAAWVGRALDSLDLAWRLAGLVTMVEESELPAGGGSVNLDDLLPIEATGLVLEGVEIGSFRTWFKQNHDSLERVIATLSAIGAIAGINVHDAISSQAQQVDEPPCHVRVVGELDEQTRQVLREQLPGLPADCMVRATILLPDGTRIVVHVPSASLPGN